ncbi:hypothetical protein HY491_00845 [Candidatus Woesearchaeota archaeon]|nr:hypothetical protein [Candidatus Woesearchaeota archaeon]
MGLSISWQDKTTETIVFHVVDIGATVRKKYFGSLHCFGDEILRDAPDGIFYIGPHAKKCRKYTLFGRGIRVCSGSGNKDRCLEVVVNKSMISPQKIQGFLRHCGLKVRIKKGL